MWGASIPLRVAVRQSNVIYAPFFASLHAGTFADAGVAIEMLPGYSSIESLVKGDAHVLVGGPMQCMRQYELDGTRLVSFATVVRRHPWFLLGRREEHLGPGQGPGPSAIFAYEEARTPALGLAWAWQALGWDHWPPEWIEGYSAEDAIKAFRNGRGDYLLHSLHTAQTLLDGGEAHVALDLSEELGRVPFTSFAASAAVLEARRDTLRALVRGYEAGVRWLRTRIANSEWKQLARICAEAFPDADPATLVRAIRRYEKLAIWPEDANPTRAEFDRFRAILTAGGWLSGTVGFDDVTASL